MIRALIAWPLALAAAVWAVARYALPDFAVEVVALIAFTPQATAAALLALVICAVLRKWAAAALALVAAAALVLAVAPRALGGPDERPGRELRIVTVNVRLGQAAPRAIVELARRERADVVLIQELTPLLVSALDGAGFAAGYPQRVLRPGLGGSGLGVYSRFPLGSPRGRAGGIAAATARVPGATPVELVAVHTRSPRSSEDFLRWRRDLRALPRARRSGPTRILAGDFNATLDHRELRTVIDSGYVDAADAVGAGLHPTWPETRRIPAAVAIDHVLVDPRIAVRSVEIHPVRYTDHRALVARVALPTPES